MKNRKYFNIIVEIFLKMAFIFLVVIGFISFSETTDEKVEKLKTEIENLKKQLSTISVTVNDKEGEERKSQNIPGTVQVGHRAISYNENGIAIGEGSGVWSEGGSGIGGIAIGVHAGSHIMSNAAHEQIIAFNHKNNKENMIGGIAIGYKTHARIGTIDLGNRDYVGEIGDINYGENLMTSNNVIDGVGSTTIGTNSINSGNFSSISGAYNTITNRPTRTTRECSGGFSGLFCKVAVKFSNVERGQQGFGSSILGTFNSIENNFSSGFAKSGMASSIVGIANRVNKSNGVVVLGAGNEITNSYLNANINPNSGYATIKELSDSLRKMSQEERLASIFVLGGGNKVNASLFSNIQGVGNKLEGLEVEDNDLNRNNLRAGDVKTFNNISSFNYINGYENFGKNINYSNIIGVKNKVEHADKTFLAGNNIVLKGTETEKASENIIIGFNGEFREDNIKESVKRTISLGNENKIKADNVVILGSEIEAKVENSVYLGSKSTAVSDAGNNLNNIGEIGETKTGGATGTVDKAVINEIEYSGFAGSKSNGGVTIGYSGGERRLMNVAAGEISDKSTDAINGSQLYSIVNSLTSLNKSLVTEVQSGKNTNITSEKGTDGNNKYTVNVSGDLKDITSISKGNTKISLDDKGINANSSKIVNIADGEISENSKDAINGSQLYKYMTLTGKDYKTQIDINKSGIAGAIAQTNIPQVTYNRRFGIGASIGLYENSFAAALGISGQNESRNLVYKASISVNDKMKVGFGAGINYSFGEIVDINKVISEPNTVIISEKPENVKDNDKLLNKIEELENQLSQNNEVINYLKDRFEKIEKNEIKIEKIIIDEFKVDSFELLDNQKLKIVNFFKNNDKEIIYIDIVGYTDIQGEYKYNLNLGLNRAEMVAKYLMEIGVNQSLINSISSSGYNNIVKQYKNTKNVKENRRVEITIIYK